MDRNELLKGVLDIHVHAGPSVASRELDAADMLKEAEAAGYRGFLVKDHYFPSMMGCQMVQRHLGNGSVEIFGSLCLNNAVGVFNLNAVDAAYGMGAKMIYFPTVSSKNHIDAHKGGFAGAGNMSVPETPVVYVDEKGELLPEAVRVLEYMAEKNIALGTGHGSAREIDALVRTAVKAGVKKILVNHPHFHIGATYRQMREWAALGAYIELNVCVFSEGSKLGPLPTSVLEEMLREVPRDRMVLDSDMGQRGNGSPVEGMYRFMRLMMDRFGVTKEEIDVMAKKNPAILMGLA
ncbi:DUF6282 family protein [Oscillibacter sp. 1-3]|uniref:DUF6282 family protein n=1 Tax=Oscillibacter sp. 1-3 TaxID=1235797 RepID=UPI000338EBDA|nr:DUF6282 family protein [Oscillibacter sp. 1-3]EOS65018.1 hypothetical protein C816_02746 [Oscillibacter sp. 1-3]